ncbi:MAG: hypothetical protein KatS3mg105_4824 [Gemmatales bacterium]|nr:MAG: hypothetical protein KatS3mg105_4824 [Gemmatales bacterium]
MNRALREQILQLYREVDEEVARAGPVCFATGRCCRFKEWGHVLYLSNLEADVLRETAPPFMGPVADVSCPFQKDRLCTAREERPLGCRIYFCDPAYQDKAAQIYENALSKLKEIARHHQLEWRYAPLYTFLNEPK